METAFEHILRKIKKAAFDLQNHSFSEFQKKLPSYINHRIGYPIMNRIFTERYGITIKDYFNRMKLQKANELLHHYRLNEHEVAYQLGYKNPGRLYRYKRA